MKHAGGGEAGVAAHYRGLHNFLIMRTEARRCVR